MDHTENIWEQNTKNPDGSQNHTSRGCPSATGIACRKLNKAAQLRLKSTFNPIAISGHTSPSLINELILRFACPSNQNKHKAVAYDNKSDFPGPEFDGFTSENEEHEISFDPFDESNDLACTSLEGSDADGFSDPKAFPPRQVNKSESKHINLLMDHYCGNH